MVLREVSGIMLGTTAGSAVSSRAGAVLGVAAGAALGTETGDRVGIAIGINVTSQRSPRKDPAHVHEYPSPSVLQAPPFMHGLDVHRSCTCSQS